MTYTSPEALIIDKIKTLIEGLTWVQTVRVVDPLLSMEVKEHEVPLVQINPQEQVLVAERNEALVRWGLLIELVLLADTDNPVDPYQLYEKIHDLWTNLGANYRLGAVTSGIIGLYPIGVSVDLHTVKPYYIGQMLFELQYRKAYVHPC